jgi:hypothetical protein
MIAKIDDGDEVLYRQIHPLQLDKGEPGSPNFIPKPNDKRQLSVDRGSRTTPEQSYMLYTVGLGRASESVYGLTVGEFASENIDCFPDPTTVPPEKIANPAHAYALFPDIAEKSWKIIAKRLKNMAIHRGKLHPTVSA